MIPGQGDEVHRPTDFGQLPSTLIVTAQIQPPPRLSRPDAPACSLSGTALTEAMKISIQSASCGYREAVPLLSQLLRRFQNADYGEENPERVQSNQLHLTANKGEVTGSNPRRPWTSRLSASANSCPTRRGRSSGWATNTSPSCTTLHPPRHTEPPGHSCIETSVALLLLEASTEFGTELELRSTPIPEAEREQRMGYTVPMRRTALPSRQTDAANKARRA